MDSMNNPARLGRAPKTPMSFLRKVWREYKSGYVFAGTKCQRTGTWEDHPFQAPIKLKALEKFLNDHPKEDYDLYFCLNSFKGKRRKATNCRPTRWAQVDVDHNDPGAYQTGWNQRCLVSFRN